MFSTSAHPPAANPYASTIFFRKLNFLLTNIGKENLLLTENFNKYAIKANVSITRGENYASPHLFDVIILDVPCSNSGVLNKRPEARWRLHEGSLNELEQIQLKLIEHAKSLLTPTGQIWLMTCSILPSENERLVEKAARLYGLSVGYQECVMPNKAGWDGGFAAVLSHL